MLQMLAALVAATYLGLCYVCSLVGELFRQPFNVETAASVIFTYLSTCVCMVFALVLWQKWNRLLVLQVNFPSHMPTTDSRLEFAVA